MVHQFGRRALLERLRNAKEAFDRDLMTINGRLTSLYGTPEELSARLDDDPLTLNSQGGEFLRDAWFIQARVPARALASWLDVVVEKLAQSFEIVRNGSVGLSAKEGARFRETCADALTLAGNLRKLDSDYEKACDLFVQARNTTMDASGEIYPEIAGEYALTPVILKAKMELELLPEHDAKLAMAILARENQTLSEVEKESSHRVPVTYVAWRAAVHHEVAKKLGELSGTSFFTGPETQAILADRALRGPATPFDPKSLGYFDMPIAELGPQIQLGRITDTNNVELLWRSGVQRKHKIVAPPEKIKEFFGDRPSTTAVGAELSQLKRRLERVNPYEEVSPARTEASALFRTVVGHVGALGNLAAIEELHRTMREAHRHGTYDPLYLVREAGELVQAWHLSARPGPQTR
ncbi:MAG: hypothetical protein HOQ05_07075 [Corynebacteriales bacterium]|nr:hypothetical protein [Mycobacteriales bacterium]